jgi:uncharacterized protein with NRDE domain
MCLIFCAVNARIDAPFILLANRDEFYIRPTQEMHFWEDSPVLAGRDLEAGGTWLALGANGKIAAVTNYRDLQHVRPDAPSRGRIPTDVVLSDLSGRDCIAAWKDQWKDCNGFNLLFHDGIDTFWYSNVTDETIQLTNGIYGLSNALLDTPWPKVEAGKRQFEAWLRSSNLDADEAFLLMSNTRQYPREQLPNTGVGQEMELLLSSICIVSPIYGTRCSTLIIREVEGASMIWEKDMQNKKIRTFKF